MKKSKRNVDKIAKEIYEQCPPDEYPRVSLDIENSSTQKFYREIAKWHLEQMEKVYGQRTVWN